MPEFARNLAFVIGVNNYTNGIPPLTTAVNDAKKIVDILRQKHGYNWTFAYFQSRRVIKALT
jgi:Caspase domain